MKRQKRVRLWATHVWVILHRTEVWSINRLTWWRDRGYLTTQEQELFERSWFLSRTDCRVQGRSSCMACSPLKLPICLRIGPLKGRGGRVEIKPHIFRDLRGIWKISFMFRPLYPREKRLRYPLDGSLRPPKLVWTQRNQALVVQSVIMHHIDWCNRVTGTQSNSTRQHFLQILHRNS
jgi:hypothetical protein